MDGMNKRNRKKSALDAKEKKSIDIASLKGYFNKQTLMGVTLIGLLVFVVVYVFVYLDYTEKTTALEQSNRELKTELTVLEEYYINMDDYKSATEEMKGAVNDILEEYPADAKEEDILMLAVQIQEEDQIVYKSINMEEKEGVYTVTRDLITASGMEGMDNDIIFTQKHATYVNETTYDDLKNCIAQVYASPSRIGIDTIVYCKNEERGTLEGNISLYFYSATGTGKEYVAPDMAEYISGTNDLFHSGRVKNNDSENKKEDVETTTE